MINIFGRDVERRNERRESLVVALADAPVAPLAALDAALDAALAGLTDAVAASLAMLARAPRRSARRHRSLAAYARQSTPDGDADRDQMQRIR